MQLDKNTCSQGGTIPLKDFKERTESIVLRRRDPFGAIPASEVTEAALPGVNLGGNSKVEDGETRPRRLYLHSDGGISEWALAWREAQGREWRASSESECPPQLSARGHPHTASE